MVPHQLSNYQNGPFQLFKAGNTLFLSVFLSLMVVKSQVLHHNCNQQLLDSTRLHNLDIHGLAALLIMYSTNESHVQSFYAMKDDQAQTMLDLLQEVKVTSVDILIKLTLV